MSFKLILVLICVCLSTLSKAADIYSFLQDRCSVLSGIPVAADDTFVTLITLKGELQKVDVEKLTGIAHYVVPNDLYQGIEFPDELNSYLLSVELKDTQNSIEVFPYHFSEEVVFFMNREGHRIVVGDDEIGRIVRPKVGKKIPEKKIGKLPRLGLPAGIDGCTSSEADLQPAKLNADKLQILEQVSTWSRGFKRIEDLVERSDFYPRSLMFTGGNRVGFFFQKMPDKEEQPLPLRIKLTSGKEFQFQSETFFGGGIDQIGPRALPMTLLSTELKYHFLHAQFIGNVIGMAKGATVFSREFSYQNRLEKRPLEASSDTSFNHIAQIGADWKRFGLSLGPLFPVVYLQSGGKAREVKPREAYPLIRFGWMNDQWKFALSHASGESRASSDVGKRSITISSDDNQSVDNFNFKFRFWRAGAGYRLSPEWDIGADIIQWDWNYKDQFGSDRINFQSKRTTLLLQARKDFGEYVSLSLNYTIEKRDEKGTGTNGTFKGDKQPKTIGGIFEFIF